MPFTHVLRRRAAVFAIAAVSAFAMTPAMPANGQQFPYDLELLMEARPMPPAKRMPSLTVSSSGRAQIDLWCRSVRGVLELGPGTVTIQAEPLPDSLPEMMARGQCTPARMQADEQVLGALTQMTGWQRHGQTVVFTGATTLRFVPSSH